MLLTNKNSTCKVNEMWSPNRMFLLAIIFLNLGKLQNMHYIFQPLKAPRKQKVQSLERSRFTSLYFFALKEILLELYSVSLLKYQELI